jgi:hypothetical protein
MGLKPRSVAVLAVSASLATAVRAHGGLIMPPCRNNHGNVDIFNFTTQPGERWLSGGSCAGDMCLWFNDGCFPGCPNCTSVVSVVPGASGEVPDRFVKPPCASPTLMEPTLPEEMRTWNIGNPSPYGDWTRYHPWRAPGFSPTSDPCGRAGANTAQSGGGETPIGAKQFDRGSLLPKLNVSTQWKRGSAASVAWMIGSNHGGGYAYSLCRSNETLSESCFQRTMLPFVGDFHTIQRLDNDSLPDAEYTM